MYYALLQRLAKDLAEDGACESHIYPKVVFIQDRCLFLVEIIQEGVGGATSSSLCRL